MQKGIIGKKIGMTQIFDETGKVIPVTVLEAGPCVVSQKKTVENDGYAAIQVGFGDLKAHRVNKPMKGHFAKGNVAPKRTLREFRLENTDNYNVGDLIKADIFAVGEKVDVTGTSKGKGYAGAMKRHGFAGQGAGHGNQAAHRRVGGIGAAATPGRIFKGKRMAGRMGNDRVTTQNLKIQKVDADANLLLIKGAVPGARGGLLVVKTATKGGAHA